MWYTAQLSVMTCEMSWFPFRDLDPKVKVGYANIPSQVRDIGYHQVTSSSLRPSTTGESER